VHNSLEDRQGSRFAERTWSAVAAILRHKFRINATGPVSNYIPDIKAASMAACRDDTGTPRRNKINGCGPVSKSVEAMELFQFEKNFGTRSAPLS
jgi:hypothetical protein